ncbi:Sialic acid TRAP transporter permease protein SiaT [Pseudooceanicola marinus]|uniref:TRAP transporter large permease protein n=1 Tax=Pseudooceanicola marinus TaxID=396013 RepID=A0A1X6Z185_9RHOB|nr:TRAP transporter large permease [Pseudooceanicola marinus]PJE32594.1 TRAP transporter large permease [Pseudooceanicola marinus]SLN35586.1 Sialic acid TRAP transporter permease protein SiaT [Pseudooceanicola marinus]
MTPLMIGYACIGAMFVILILGAPIGLAMITVGFVGFSAIIGMTPALAVLKTATFETITNYSFTLIPLFLLMGNLISRSGVAADLFRGALLLTRGWSGGLAAAGMTASAVFSTVSGSSLATASTMTRVAYPEMKAHGYDPRLATGSLAAGGTLGILIPPSIALMLYALITEQSVGTMFLAGILPGILAFVLYIVTILIMSRIWSPDPEIAAQAIASEAEAAGPARRFETLRLFAPAIILFGLVMGGLYGNFFTPTEAGGVGAALSLIFALWRRVPRAELVAAFVETIITCGSIFLILIGAEVFGFVLSTSQLSNELVRFLDGSGFGPWQVLIVILVFYVILGCFMESLAMILLTVPIFFPVVLANGFDPIWFGVIAVVTVELGMITPPVGMNLFMVKSASRDTKLTTIMTGVIPFVVTDVIRLGILLAFPAISLLLTGRL